MPPRILYKFRSWNDQNHKRLITRREIFFASPRSFNDPFDCRIPIQFLGASKPDIKRVLRESSKKRHPNLNREQRARMVDREYQDYKQRSKNPAFRDQAEEKYLNGVFSTFGVFSLSETYDNILLWSHYADGHQGYCVGFDAAQLKKAVAKKLHFASERERSELLQVRYQQDYPVLNAFDARVEPIELLNTSLTVKSKVWQYEQEWRLIIIYATNKTVTLPQGVIVKVILGAWMPDEARQALKGELAKKDEEIEILQARLRRDSFGLDFGPTDDVRLWGNRNRG